MKFFILTLGCKVNQYESQAIFEKLVKAGFENSENIEAADIIIINSCTVTAESDKKVRKLINKAKKDNENALVVLTGCMAQTLKKDSDILKKVDMVLGNSQKEEILDRMNELLLKREKSFYVGNFDKNCIHDNFYVKNFSNRTRAFVKIEDGCNRFCSYCIIPYARGRVRSKPLEKIYSEIKELAENGYKEVVLVGINLFSYGQDINSNLCEVIEKISKIDSLKRIRLGSLEPECMSEDVIKRLSKQEKLCPQFHLSLQSGCNETLKRMNRHYSKEEYFGIVCNLRKYFKNSSITTDVMVGFEGETDEEFKDSLEFIKSVGFSKAHVFPYSIREGTKAALFKNHVPQNIKIKRTHIVIDATQKSRENFLKSQVDLEEEVLFEREVSKNLYEGYTRNYTPVICESLNDISGEILNVKVYEVLNDKCLAKVVN